MSNKRFTVLNLNQVYGDGRLDVFNRYGSEAEVTILLIILYLLDLLLKIRKPVIIGLLLK